MPAVYMLLPRDRHEAVVLEGSGEPVDLLDIDTWIQYRWGLADPRQDRTLRWLLPDVVAAFLWSSTLSDNGLVNTLVVKPLGMSSVNFINQFALPVVIIANIWKGVAWSYLLFSAALDSIPRETIEAAKVDGATALQRTYLITLPMLRHHIATNLLFITIWTFTYFPLIYAMTGGGPGRQTQVLAVFMYEQIFKVGKLGYGSAISVAMLAVVGLLSIFYVRLLREPK